MVESSLENVILNRFGFYELKKKPSVEELNQYYSQKYYQDTSVQYSHSYSEEEICFFKNKIAQKHHVLSGLMSASKDKPTLLDIGAGEGWALDYYKKQGWKCLGLDYSEAGCKGHNPGCIDDLLIGDIPQTISKFLKEGRTFDVVWVDNVLEHLVDPLASLKDFSRLVSDEGILVVEVPNDFSLLQNSLLEAGHISRPFWVVIPDHISYFNRQGLISICREAGWHEEFMMGDFPIDFNLFNPLTNYVEDKSTGKSCHKARISIENLMHGISVEKSVELYGKLSELGLGRQIVGFFRKVNQVK